jgi:hypothetical protein
MKKATAFMLVAAVLVSVFTGGDSRNARNSLSDFEYDLLVQVFGRRQVDLHDDLGSALSDGETAGSVVGHGGSLANAEEARAVLTEIVFPENEWFTINSLEFIGENDSYFVFRMDGTYHNSPFPDEHELSRVHVEKSDVPLPAPEQNFINRESALRRLEEVVGENVPRSERGAVLRRLTAVMDAMHTTWEIWSTPCDCWQYQEH